MYMFRAVERTTNVVDADTLQVAPAAEVVTVIEQWFHLALGRMIYQFIVHTVDMKGSKLVDKLATRDVISREQKDRLKKLKKAEDKVDCLLRTLREKSASEFESFLATLSETGQQTVADVIRQALDTTGLTGQNPLQHLPYGKAAIRCVN